jgi:hypothetical protein
MRIDISKKSYHATIEVHFKTSSFFPFMVRQQLTTVDFISYCGRSLGLFLGFSAVSMLEIVYYFTLRIICLKKQQTQVEAISETNEPSKTTKYPIEIVENSSVHGCNQIVMAKRHWIERILWTVLVSIAVVFCASTTYSFIMKYKDTPIMMKYEDSIGSEEITFPAITFNNEHTTRFAGAVVLIYRFAPQFEWISEIYGERQFFLKSYAKMQTLIIFVCSLFIELYLCDEDIIIRTRQFVEAYRKLNKTVDFYNKIRQSYHPKWFINQTASWNTNYKPTFVESLTKRSFGYTFNMLADSKLLTNE